MWPTSTEAARRLRPVARAGRAGAFAALALVVAACNGPGARPDPADGTGVGPDPAAVAAFDGALAALAAGDAAAAESRFAALAQSHPDYAGPLVNLATLRAARGELEPATALLERAVAVCTSCAVPWNELGVLQRRQGHFAEAEKCYLRAIEADPGYAAAWFNLGVLYELYLQRPELALDRYAQFRVLRAEDPMGKDVDKWIADLERRTQAVERSAQLEAPP
jgi:tetratricopeptide (TPR) repeat protein